MMILALVRNYIPSYDWVTKGGWNIADCVERSYDLEGMTVGTFGAGRIGLAVLRRLKPFDVDLHYTDKYRLDEATERELGLTYHRGRGVARARLRRGLHPHAAASGDGGALRPRLLGTMKRGAYLINTARGKICDRDAVVEALENGQLAGYAGDVWYPQPAPASHPWRTMPHHGMTPHISGSSLSAQARYAAGTREILESFFAGRRSARSTSSSTAAGWPAPAHTPTPPAPRARARRPPDGTVRQTTPGTVVVSATTVPDPAR